MDQAPRCRHEPERRVLGAQTGLDRVTERCARSALEPPTCGDMQLKLDEIEPRDCLRHRMLDLKPGVHLHE